MTKKGHLAMQSITLKYGLNPNQKSAKIFMKEGNLPLTIQNGSPGYINLLDALNGLQLVLELEAATGFPAAASFKHVSPAGAAIGLPLSREHKQACYAAENLSPLACAYARARGADRMSSFGDFIALSDACDKETALFIEKEVSDGIIAPGYKQEALDILKKKRKGNYTILSFDKDYIPPHIETREVFGITFQQERNESIINEELLSRIVTENTELPKTAKRDLLVALITLKYTQSNSICYAYDGQTIGVGAGQQSRIHCTGLAGDKADIWQLRRHPKVMNLPFLKNISRPERDNCIDVYLGEHPGDVIGDDVWAHHFERQPKPFPKEEKREWLSGIKGIAMGSDAFLPFDDNIRRAYRSGVSYIAQPGGSIRDHHVIDACNDLGIVMAFTKMRLFHH